MAKHPETTEWPEWLREADTEDAVVEIKNGIVYWYGGVWRGGVWRDGVWRGGVWHDGVWHGGVWYGGVWHGGEWYDGVWRGGEWHGGVWRGGVWYDGVWYDGVWYDGVWHDGVWCGGVWCGGVWYANNPRFAIIGSRRPVVFGKGGLICIGCEQHTAAEWREQFDTIADKRKYSTELRVEYREYIEIMAAKLDAYLTAQPKGETNG